MDSFSTGHCHADQGLTCGQGGAARCYAHAGRCAVPGLAQPGTVLAVPRMRVRHVSGRTPSDWWNANPSPGLSPAWCAVRHGVLSGLGWVCLPSPDDRAGKGEAGCVPPLARPGVALDAAFSEGVCYAVACMGRCWHLGKVEIPDGVAPCSLPVELDAFGSWHAVPVVAELQSPFAYRRWLHWFALRFGFVQCPRLPIVR